MTIAFFGVFALKDLAWTAFSLYLFKVVYEIVLTPVSTRFANWAKTVERVDEIDYPETTNYNPFAVFKRSAKSSVEGLEGGT